MEEQDIRELVEEAHGTNFDSEDINYFSDLINGEYREFLKLQFEAALAQVLKNDGGYFQADPD